jgi:hypothetical protein
MDYEFFKKWIFEISGLTAAIIVIAGFIKPIVNFFVTFPQKSVRQGILALMVV